MIVTAREIIESIPIRFRSEKAQDYNTVFHFVIEGTEALQYTVIIRNGHCELKNGLHETPDCVLNTEAGVYVDLETGKASPQMALLSGKVRISNIAAMMQFSKCFRKFQTTDDGQQAANGNDPKPESRNYEAAVRQAKSGPLAGVKIIDFTRLLPGPMATMFLADLGADVIKIEDPDSPDYIRSFEPVINGMSMLYLALNRNKRSLAVNYLSQEGRKIIHELVKNADVLIEQFRPGIMQDLGFGYEELLKLNPKLIYVSVTGYGLDSSKAMHAGHDLNYMATAGALGITGTESEVVIPGFQLADIAGGSYMAMNAVTAALYQREKTGKGDWVDVAMTDAAVPLSALQFAYYQGTKHQPGRGQFELSGGLPNYNVYRCRDGKHIALGSLEPKFWNKFCTKVNRPEWSEKFLLKGEALSSFKKEVSDFFLTKTSAEWLSGFQHDDFCFTIVNELKDLEHDAYLQERNMFLENTHPAVGNYKTINQPLKFKQTNFENNWSAPDLGDDSENILKEQGYSDAAISDLKSKGVIKVNQ